MISFKKKHPCNKTVYAVTGGAYLGELLVLIEDNTLTKEHCFLALPDMHIRRVPYDKFEFGLTNKIIDIVTKIPNHVYKTCVKQYLKNKNTPSNPAESTK